MSTTVGIDGERLHALLGGPELAWLRHRVRARLERGGQVDGTVRLQSPRDAERAAVDRLLGRRPTASATLTIRLADLERLLRDAQVCDGLRTAIELLDGPVVDRAAALAQEEAAWEAALAAARQAVDGSPWLAGWLDELAATGLVRRLATGPEDGRRLLDDAVAVLTALPAGGVGLARFAADVLCDSHALDDERPTTTLVLKGLQHRSSGDAAGGRVPRGEERRALWAEAGVLREELAAPVLVLNLPADGQGLCDETLRAHARSREPARLTLRQLVRHPPRLTGLRGATVYLCENPAVVSAAAEQLAGRSAPLVCVEGQPSSAAQTLLRLLREAGAELVHHGDFDWGGLRIANLLARRYRAALWRFDAAAYRAAPAGPALTGRPVAAVWDRDLAPTMRVRGVAVHEEQVIDDLLADLEL